MSVEDPPAPARDGSAFAVISPEVLNIESLSPIGNSEHATVYEGKWSGKVVAVKRLPEDTPAETVIQQVKSWSQLSNPHIIHLFGASPADIDPPYIVSEFMANGNISSHVLKNPRVDRKKLMHEIAIGMEYLHEKNVIHGSLKASNVLVNASGQACLSDFGLYQWKASSSAQSCGRYLSPEAWKGTVSKPADVFAFAMTSYELFTSSQPWGFLADAMIYNLVVREGERPDRPDRDWELKIGMNDHLWSLIEACWKQDPRGRPTFQQLLPMFESGVIQRRRTSTGPSSNASAPAASSSPRNDAFANLSSIAEPLTPNLPSYGGAMSSSPPPQASSPPAARASAPLPAVPAATPSNSAAAARLAQAHASKQRVAAADADPNDSMPPPPAYNPVGDPEPEQGGSSQAYAGSSSNRSPPSSQGRNHLPQQRMMVVNTDERSPPLHAAALPQQPHGQALFHNPNSMYPAMGGVPLAASQYGPPGVVTNAPIAAAGMTQLHAPRATPPPAQGQIDRWAQDGQPPQQTHVQYIDARGHLVYNAPASAYQTLTPPVTQQTFTDQRRASAMSNTSWDSSGAAPAGSLFSGSPLATPRSATFAQTIAPIPEVYGGMDPARVMSPHSSMGSPPIGSVRGSSPGTLVPNSAGSGPALPSALLVVGALTTEMNGSRNRDLIDEHLVGIHRLALSSEKDIQKLITAGAIPTLIQLMKARALDGNGLEVVMVTLGLLAHDSVSANTVSRTGTTKLLFEIIDTSQNQDVIALAIWVVIRLCRSNELVADLLKANILPLLLRNGLNGANVTARMASWCIGNLVRTDATADQFAMQGIIETCVNHLLRVTSMPTAVPEDKCAAMYSIARLARSIKLSKQIAKAGGVEPLVHFLTSSNDPNLLRWSARAIGCLMRPNSADMSKTLLDAGAAAGLARLPQVIPTECIDPLESFAFAIQRFSCAEWGSTTRKALVEAGVVDSLLAALRTASDVPYPQTHIELALAVSFLGDVGGASIRKEITKAGGIEILRSIAAAGKPEVAKACNMAVTSITGNLWTRNAASAKTAMSHNWSGGCPDHQPPCPPLSAGAV